MWFHSHELGITRLNIYAGLAGFYRCAADRRPARGRATGPEPVRVRADDPGPIVQPRRIAVLPRHRPFFGDVPPGGPFIPETDVPPMWNPEFFGNTMVVNGEHVARHAGRGQRGTGSGSSTRATRAW
jgi:bilirubin oxidase